MTAATECQNWQCILLREWLCQVCIVQGASWQMQQVHDLLLDTAKTPALQD